MAYVALVTLLLILQYLAFMMLVGMSRDKAKIEAPATTGEERFEISQRIHLNTLEQLMIAIPSMWICAHYFSPKVAAILGLVFFVGRLVYAKAYLAKPESRGPGMMIGFIAYIAMIACALWGIVGGII